MKNILLYFGSFNPIHKGHIALAEYAVECALCDEVILIVSPQNPLKKATELAPEMDRFEMAEIACAASRYPDRIKPSVIEFLLDKPSYTIQTLHYLQQTHGDDMRFSILMGADLVEQLDQWKDYTQIVGHYPIYVYPRHEHCITKFGDQLVYLEEAPLCDFSSTLIREAAGRGEQIAPMTGDGVAKYIADKGLWNMEARICFLAAQLESEPRIELYIERGKLYYSLAEWGKALNDFRAVLRLDAENREASEYVNMIEEILAFRYKDIYNP